VQSSSGGAAVTAPVAGKAAWSSFAAALKKNAATPPAPPAGTPNGVGASPAHKADRREPREDTRGAGGGRGRGDGGFAARHDKPERRVPPPRVAEDGDDPSQFRDFSKVTGRPHGKRRDEEARSGSQG
jgi:hypothetical protein